MGTYLGKPVTSKQSKDGILSIAGKDCQFAVTAMQGWRISMEDCHVVIPDFSEDAVLLGVFDGHGGREVAEYCSRHIQEFITRSEHYRNEDASLTEALKEAYLNCDRSLLEQSAQEEMKKIVEEDMEMGEGEDTEEEMMESEGEVEKLVEEAEMPLEEVLKMKLDAKQLVKSLTEIANRDLNKKRGGGCSSSADSNGDGDDDDDTDKENGGGRLRNYEKYIQELLTREKPLATELLSLFDVEFSDSEDDEEEEEEEEEEGQEGEELDGVTTEEGQEEKELNKATTEEKQEEKKLNKATTEEKQEEKELNKAATEEKQEEKELDKVSTEEGKEGEELDGVAREEKQEEKELDGMATEEGQDKGEGLEKEEEAEQNDEREIEKRQELRNKGQEENEIEEIRNRVTDEKTAEDEDATNEDKDGTKAEEREEDKQKPEVNMEEKKLEKVQKEVIKPKEENKTEKEKEVTENNKEKKESTLITNGNESEQKGNQETRKSKRKRKREPCGEMKESSAKRQEGKETEEPELEGFESGTTAVVCLIKGEELVVANTGDSRCIMSCNGKAKDLSKDHKPSDPIEESRITKAGGYIDEDLRVNGGLNLSRAIGDHIYKQNKDVPLEEQMITSLPDVTLVPLSSTDEFIVIASDGIWNCTTSQDVVDFVRKRLINLKNGEPLSEVNQDKEQTVSMICEELCDMCLAPNTDNDGSGCDNMTVTIALLKPLQSLF